jgi:uncharacterized protein (DUF1697 family)
VNGPRACCHTAWREGKVGQRAVGPGSELPLRTKRTGRPVYGEPSRKGVSLRLMAVIVSLLRGVNIGGHHKIKMDALRALYQSLGLRDPQTYVQSGNVVFKSAQRNLDLVAKRIEEGIERRFGFRPSVFVRTPSELRDVIARNPFATRRGLEPRKLAVTFLATDAGKEVRDRVLAIQTDPEELWFLDRELYIYFPNGMGRSKLPALLERTLKTPGTSRNWNTVTKLLEIAEGMEAAR